MRLDFSSTAVVGDSFGVSDRAVAAIASSVLHDVGLTTSNNSGADSDSDKEAADMGCNLFQLKLSVQ
ncbi:hypothetical protein AVEN_112096-1 [Araneus ventricosus]|uniref:Uncharacterized protein n=1 Tax=Araneus ventricosus TaxID=182803 RepID=A0A4Y2MB38_ARAVE|nr:hypothetical protein AVEN_112096-1 [Araneus ventricosus]